MTAARSSGGTPDRKAPGIATRWAVLGALFALCAAGVYALPPLAQDQAYHQFADQRTLLGIPHFGDVVSNLPFVLVGLYGLRVFRGHCVNRVRFLDPREAWAVAAAVFGIGIGGIASAYYHWAPDNSGLVWDRLPMGVGFMSIFAMVLTERVDARWGIRLLAPLVLIGLGSVLYWDFTEQMGRGDLRPYALVQFFPMLAVPVMLYWFPARYTGEGYLWGLIAGYGLAKVCEYFDWELYHLTGGLISGHSLKHLTAAGAYFLLIRYVEKRSALTLPKNLMIV